MPTKPRTKFRLPEFDKVALSEMQQLDDIFKFFEFPGEGCFPPWSTSSSYIEKDSIDIEERSAASALPRLKEKIGSKKGNGFINDQEQIIEKMKSIFNGMISLKKGRINKDTFNKNVDGMNINRIFDDHGYMKEENSSEMKLFNKRLEGFLSQYPAYRKAYEKIIGISSVPLLKYMKSCTEVIVYLHSENSSSIFGRPDGFKYFSRLFDAQGNIKKSPPSAPYKTFLNKMQLMWMHMPELAEQFEKALGQPPEELKSVYPDAWACRRQWLEKRLSEVADPHPHGRLA